VAGGLDTGGAETVEASGWPAGGGWVDVFFLFDQPAGLLKAGEDWIELAAREAGQPHEFVSIVGLRDIVEEGPKHHRDGSGHPHIGHV